jgi:HD-GYP domain-containing protein (c-di-GMP phosphodiesterase class II)
VSGKATQQGPHETRRAWSVLITIVACAASGLIALAATVAFSLGITGLLAFALPPTAMLLAVHRYATRTDTSLEKARQAIERLLRANDDLATRNEDLVETVRALARTMEAKDYYTGGRTERVSGIAVALARRLGYDGADLDAIEIAALVHDIGKIGIPERILHKPSLLDEEEWKVMREHPMITEYILQDVDLHPIVRQVARSSHERIDGQGYPDGKAGDEIPLPARIVLVADALDALTTDLPYRTARTTEAAIDELRRHGATQFCPQVIDALEQVYREQPDVLGAVELRAAA